MNGHGVIPLTSLKLFRPVGDTASHLKCKCKHKPEQCIFKTAVHWPSVPLLSLKWRKSVAVLSRCLWISAHIKKPQLQLVRKDLGLIPFMVGACGGGGMETKNRNHMQAVVLSHSQEQA